MESPKSEKTQLQAPNPETTGEKLA